MLLLICIMYDTVTWALVVPAVLIRTLRLSMTFLGFIISIHLANVRGAQFEDEGSVVSTIVHFRNQLV
jgi:hypothetical protein